MIENGTDEIGVLGSIRPAISLGLSGGGCPARGRIAAAPAAAKASQKIAERGNFMGSCRGYRK